MSSFVKLAGCLGGLRGRGRPFAHGVRGPRAGGPLRILATAKGQLLRALAPVEDLTRAASWLQGHLSCLRQALKLLARSTRLAFSATVSLALVPELLVRRLDGLHPCLVVLVCALAGRAGGAQRRRLPVRRRCPNEAAAGAARCRSRQRGGQRTCRRRGAHRHHQSRPWRPGVHEGTVRVLIIT